MSRATATLTLGFLPGEYSIHRFPAGAAPPDLDRLPAFSCLLRAESGWTLVCDSALEPSAPQSSHGWSLLRVEGELDFSMTGVLSGIATALAAAGVSIFALSAWETDYLLLRSEQQDLAKSALIGAGYGWRE